MAFNFKVYEGVTLESLGTLASVIGVGGSVRFTSTSVSDQAKRLCVVMTKADGTSDTVNCSAAVTKGLRAAFASGKTKRECLAAIINLEILETEKGNFISAPRGESGVESFTVSDLRKVRVNYEDLVAL